MTRYFAVLLLLTTLAAECNAAGQDISARPVVCPSRIEPVDGEVDVCAQAQGTITRIDVLEGQRVTSGSIIAQIDDQIPRAEVDLAAEKLKLAEAELSRIRRGVGAEEILEAELKRQSVESELELARRDLNRITQLAERKVVSPTDLDSQRFKAQGLEKLVSSLQKRFEALKRGALPEELAVSESRVASARGELDLARAKLDYCLVKSPRDGIIVRLYRHVGDTVSPMYPCPIMQLADVSRLQMRAEIVESDVYAVSPGMTGVFRVYGVSVDCGQITVRQVLPHFAPKRLFETDTGARIDCRTMQVLCDITSSSRPLYSGQRATAYFQGLAVDSERHVRVSE